MARLEDLKQGAQVKGIDASGQVSVINVKWFGSDVVELTYRDQNGQPYTELLYCDHEADLEVIVADILTRLGLSLEYEKKIAASDDSFDFRLPDFTIGFEGDILYWEHLGMLTVPAYREGWERKRCWYEERLNMPVIGDGAEGEDIAPGTFPIVITSRDGENGSINVSRIEQLIRKYILLED